MEEKTHVAIIGGGLTGVALGYYLKRHGVPHLVLEADDRVGGVIHSRTVDGHLLESGPQRTRLTAGIRELIDELDLSSEVLTAPAGLPLFVYRAGRLRLVPFNAVDFLRSDIVSVAAKARLLAEPMMAGARAEETVAEYFTRKVGRDLYDSLLGPLYGGLYASDPADMVVGLSLGHVLREFGIGRSLLAPLVRRGGAIDPPAACSFVEGLETLPRALQAANADNVRIRHPVDGIERGHEGWTVHGAGGSVEAKEVVLTVPAPAAAELLRPVDAAASRAVAQLRYNPLAVAHLYAPEARLRGLGYQVAFGEKLVTRGVTFNDSLFGRAGVFTAYLGGAKAPIVTRWSDAEVAAVACREFREVTGFPAEAIAVSREWMPAWDRSWSATVDLALPPGIRIAANWQARPGIPGRLVQARRLADELAGGRETTLRTPAVRASRRGSQ